MLLTKTRAQYDRALLDEAAKSPAHFRACLRLDADTIFHPADFQAADFAAADPGWLRCAGRQAEGGHSRLWIERTRGSSKTTDVAIMALWPLAFSTSAVTGIVAAGDLDQAGLLRGAIERLIEANPWLKSRLQVNRWQVRNPATGSQLEIISSDAATSYGALVDFAVVDEVSHWSEGRGQELWVSILSTVAKKPNCLLVVISNAGWVDTWQWELREKIRKDPAWYFHALEGPASWITAEHLAEQERLLPPKEYRRLWRNVWVSAAGAEWPESYFPESIYFSDWPENLLFKVVCLDPTQGKTARPGDYAAFVVLGIDRGAHIWVKAELHQSWTTSQQAERVLDIYREQGCTALGVESVLFSQLLKQDVDRLARARGMAVASYGLPSTVAKTSRIVSLTPYLSQGLLRVMDDEGGRLLVQQMRNFSMKMPAGLHDDGPDAVEQAVRLTRYLLGQRGQRDRPKA